VVAWLAQHSVVVDPVCFTAREASTAGGSREAGPAPAKELHAAAAGLGVVSSRRPEQRAASSQQQ